MSPIAKKLQDISEVNEDNFSEGNKRTLEEAASTSIVIITFTERQPHVAAREVMSLYILHSAFMSNKCQDLLKKNSRLCHRVSPENPISSVVYTWLSKCVVKAPSRFLKS